ncbi:MAG: TetR family transcriptional regulator [Thermoanaerobaculia bacterium]
MSSELTPRSVNGAMATKTKQAIVEEFRLSSIQDAAMRVIARNGLRATTMNDIAEEAEIAKATIYLYFRDRDELLEKVADRAFGALMTDIASVFDAPGTLETLLLSLVIRQIRFFDGNRELFLAYIDLTQRDATARLRRRREQSHAGYVERMARLFDAAIAAGELRPIDTMHLAALFTDGLRGVIVRRMEEQPKLPPEPFAEFIVSVFLHGVAEPESLSTRTTSRIDAGGET